MKLEIETCDVYSIGLIGIGICLTCIISCIIYDTINYICINFPVTKEYIFSTGVFVGVVGWVIMGIGLILEMLKEKQ